MAFSANQVAPGLWQGSAPPANADLRDRFDLVVLAAGEYQPVIHAARIIKLNLDDAMLSTREAQLALSASKVVAEAVRRGEKVLVTCFMGLNRSGLISALALRRLGYPAVAAIAAVRRARGDEALRNPSFLQFITKS